MTKVRLGNLWLAAAVAGVILCAVLMRAFYMPYSGFLRTVLYNILIFSWAVSVWWRILHAQTRRCLLGAAALMLFWLDIRLIRYDFAQTPEMLRRLWYAYYIPMLLIPTLALYTLFFFGLGAVRPAVQVPVHDFCIPCGAVQPRADKRLPSACVCVPTRAGGTGQPPITPIGSYITSVCCGYFPVPCSRWCTLYGAAVFRIQSTSSGCRLCRFFWPPSMLYCTSIF